MKRLMDLSKIIRTNAFSIWTPRNEKIKTLPASAIPIPEGEIGIKVDEEIKGFKSM